MGEEKVKEDRIAVPVFLLRHNFTIADKRRRTDGKKEFYVPSRFGAITVSYLTDAGVITPAHTKVFLSVINLVKQALDAVPEEKRSVLAWDMVKDGIRLNQADVRKYRGFSKAIKNHMLIRDSLYLFHRMSIYSKEMWFSLHSVSRVEEWFTLIPKFKLLRPVIPHWMPDKKEVYLDIKLCDRIYQALMDKKRIIYFPKETLFKLDGLAFNLYLFIYSQNLSKRDIQYFSIEELIRESGYFNSNQGEKYPGRKNVAIKRALNLLVKHGAIKSFMVSKDYRVTISHKGVLKVQKGCTQSSRGVYSKFKTSPQAQQNQSTQAPLNLKSLNPKSINLSIEHTECQGDFNFEKSPQENGNDLQSKVGGHKAGEKESSRGEEKTKEERSTDTPQYQIPSYIDNQPRKAPSLTSELTVKFLGDYTEKRATANQKTSSPSIDTLSSPTMKRIAARLRDIPGFDTRYMSAMMAAVKAHKWTYRELDDMITLKVWQSEQSKCNASKVIFGRIRNGTRLGECEERVLAQIRGEKIKK